MEKARQKQGMFRIKYSIISCQGMFYTPFKHVSIPITTGSLAGREGLNEHSCVGQQWPSLTNQTSDDHLLSLMADELKSG